MTALWQDKPWLRRAAFVGGNLAGLFAIITLIVMPLQSLFAERDARIARQAEILARARAIAERAPDIERLAREGSADIARGEFLLGTNEGVAAAGLQARLKTMAVAAGARLRSEQGLPAINEGPLRYLGARLQISGPLQAIQRTTHAAAAARPYLFVGLRP